MSGIDTALLAVVLLSTLLGVYWGLIRQVLSLAGLLAGLALAAAYSGEAAVLLSSVLPDDLLARAVGFVLIFAAVSGAASLIASLLRRLVGLLFLGWLDHVAGGVLGAAQGAIFCGAALALAAAIPLPIWTPLVEQSQLAPTIVRLTGAIIFAVLPDSFRSASQLLLGAP
jgi:membrane protein required for colicin V production